MVDNSFLDWKFAVERGRNSAVRVPFSCQGSGYWYFKCLCLESNLEWTESLPAPLDKALWSGCLPGLICGGPAFGRRCG